MEKRNTELITEKLIKTDLVLQMIADEKAKNGKLSKKVKEISSELSTLKLELEAKDYLLLQESKKMEQLEADHKKLTIDYNSLKCNYERELSELANLQVKYQSIYRDLNEAKSLEEKVKFANKKRTRKKPILKFEDSSLVDLENGSDSDNDEIWDNLGSNLETNLFSDEVMQRNVNLREEDSLNDSLSKSDIHNSQTPKNSDENLLLKLKRVQEEKSNLEQLFKEKEIDLKKKFEEMERELKKTIENLQLNIDQKNELLEKYKVKEKSINAKWEEKQEIMNTKLKNLENKINDEKCLLMKKFEDQISSLKSEWKSKEESLLIEIRNLKWENEDRAKIRKNVETKESSVKKQHLENEIELREIISNLEAQINSLRNGEQCKKHTTNKFSNENNFSHIDEIRVSLQSNKNEFDVVEKKEYPVTSPSCNDDEEEFDNDDEYREMLKNMNYILLSPIPESPFDRDEVLDNDNAGHISLEQEITEFTETKAPVQQDEICEDESMPVSPKERVIESDNIKISENQQSQLLEVPSIFDQIPLSGALKADITGSVHPTNSKSQELAKLLPSNDKTNSEDNKANPSSKKEMVKLCDNKLEFSQSSNENITDYNTTKIYEHCKLEQAKMQDKVISGDNQVSELHKKDETIVNDNAGHISLEQEITEFSETKAPVQQDEICEDESMPQSPTEKIFESDTIKISENQESQLPELLSIFEPIPLSGEQKEDITEFVKPSHSESRELDETKVSPSNDETISEDNTANPPLEEDIVELDDDNSEFSPSFNEITTHYSTTKMSEHCKLKRAKMQSHENKIISGDYQVSELHKKGETILDDNTGYLSQHKITEVSETSIQEQQDEICVDGLMSRSPKRKAIQLETIKISEKQESQLPESPSIFEPIQLSQLLKEHITEFFIHSNSESGELDETKLDLFNDESIPKDNSLLKFCDDNAECSSPFNENTTTNIPKHCKLSKIQLLEDKINCEDQVSELHKEDETFGDDNAGYRSLEQEITEFSETKAPVQQDEICEDDSMPQSPKKNEMDTIKISENQKSQLPEVLSIFEPIPLSQVMKKDITEFDISSDSELDETELPPSNDETVMKDRSPEEVVEFSVNNSKFFNENATDDCTAKISDCKIQSIEDKIISKNNRVSELHKKPNTDFVTINDIEDKAKHRESDWSERYEANRKKKILRYNKLSNIKKAKHKFWMEISRNFKNNNCKKLSFKNKEVSSETTSDSPIIPDTSENPNTVIDRFASVFADIVLQKLKKPNPKLKHNKEKNVLEINKMLLNKAKQEIIAKYSSPSKEIRTEESSNQIVEEGSSMCDGINNANVSMEGFQDIPISGINSPTSVDSCYDSISYPPSIESVISDSVIQEKKENIEIIPYNSTVEETECFNTRKPEMIKSNDLLHSRTPKRKRPIRGSLMAKSISNYNLRSCALQINNNKNKAKSKIESDFPVLNDIPSPENLNCSTSCELPKAKKRRLSSNVEATRKSDIIPKETDNLPSIDSKHISTNKNKRKLRSKKNSVKSAEFICVNSASSSEDEPESVSSNSQHNSSKSSFSLVNDVNSRDNSNDSDATPPSKKRKMSPVEGEVESVKNLPDTSNKVNSYLSDPSDPQSTIHNKKTVRALSQRKSINGEVPAISPRKREILPVAINDDKERVPPSKTGTIRSTWNNQSVITKSFSSFEDTTASSNQQKTSQILCSTPNTSSKSSVTNKRSPAKKKVLASNLDKAQITIIQDIILRPKKKPLITAINTAKSGGFKKPLSSKILPACPQSPTLQTEEIEAVAPVIIPLEKPAELQLDKATSLFKRLITFSTEDNTVEEVGRYFMNQDPEYISRLILMQIIHDKDKLSSSDVPRAPLMTHTQRVMLGFMLKLEKLNVNNLINTYLRMSELFLIHNKAFSHVESLTKLHVAICKSHGYIERMRRFCLDAFYFMDDLAIPFLFVVLTSWIEVLPSSKDSDGSLLIKVLVQLVQQKSCVKPGYNLLPLRELLHKFYEYPKEPWKTDDFFKELFNSYLKNPVTPADLPIIIYCKNNSSKWVCQKIESCIKPILPSVNDNFKATLIVLVGNIMSPFKGKSHWQYVSSTRNWLESLMEDDNLPDVVLRSIMYALTKISKKKFNNSVKEEDAVKNLKKQDVKNPEKNIELEENVEIAEDVKKYEKEHVE